MGRKPYKNLNLPPRLRARQMRSGKVWYYYDTGERPRKEIPLGSDYALAVKKWAELEIDAQPRHAAVATFRYVATRYLREVLPQKSPRTQRDNLKEIENLFAFFDNPPAPLEGIEPIHIRQYLDWRGKAAKVRANREKALFSHIWNKAREWGYTDKANPCQGVKDFRERGRDIYVEDGVFRAVYERACAPVRDAMDLAYLTGQRPGDVLALRETDIRDGALELAQLKTGKKLRIAITGELAEAVERILARKKAHKVRSLTLVCNEEGQPLTAFALRSRFDKARMAAAKALKEEGKDDLAAAVGSFQFRDLRAKAGTDKAESRDIREAQKQLGHQTLRMTEHYVRNRHGEKVEPTK